MKRFLVTMAAAIAVLSFGAAAQAAYDPAVDYSKQMEIAAVATDYTAGAAAEAARNEKIAATGTGETAISFNDLMLLSKIIYAEAGSMWLSEEWKMCVGEVVLNRVASPEFPNTIAEVLEQPGQYYGKNSRYFNNLKPNELSVRAAMRLLHGERLMQPSVVFQANFKQGSGTHTACYDKQLGWTYFCFSSKPELYVVNTAVTLSEDEQALIQAADMDGGKEPVE